MERKGLFVQTRQGQGQRNKEGQRQHEREEQCQEEKSVHRQRQGQETQQELNPVVSKDSRKERRVQRHLERRAFSRRTRSSSSNSRLDSLDVHSTTAHSSIDFMFAASSISTAVDGDLVFIHELVEE